MEPEKDIDLVKAFIDGDESAFNRLVFMYQKKIYHIARNITGNHLDADEVTQEVLIVMYSKLKDFRFEAGLYTWIYRITYTRAINQVRKNSVRKFFSLDDESAQELTSSGNFVHEYENREKIDRIRTVMDELPVKQREVFTLRNFENLTYEEISSITGKTVGALKANYFHALKKVTELMNENR
ncbi:MAG: RNA polymerase sigma factor [Ignavibacteriales bacterium]|nr:RNA polymerase sigma factor [Ignavibacteriales bacterium]MCF8305379.1 RNA polymerase sigma factor [Ignavibacteriales bacterium]MCF8316062.1 RNA polymerase sigma factor [Ignavibacteriales bacterium]MCF8436564.1 RNA polymerase sigma factor [Ignavibacteriales bacterium]